MPPPNGSPVRRRSSSGGQAPSTARTRRSSSTGGNSKLVCIAGPASGQEFLLEGDELVVGRAADNAISIPDTSVSRRHVSIRQVGSGWSAVDLGSGNGTLINGAQITKETPLNDGDTISLGDTDLRFQAGASAGSSRALAKREPVEVSRSLRRPVRTMSRNSGTRISPELKEKQRLLKIRIGIAVAALLMPLIGWKVKQSVDANKAAQIEAQRQKAFTELRILQQDAKRLIVDGKWAEAKEKLDEIVARDAQFEAADMANYLARAEKEIPNQKLLNEARAAIAEGKMTVAHNALEKVSSDTMQGQTRSALKAELEVLITKSLDKARLMLVATSDEAQMNRLLALSQDVLGARPDQRDAVEFKKLAEDALARIADGRKPPPPPADSSERGVQRRFIDGDVNTAFSMAQECAGRNAKCRALQGQIKEFIEGYKKLESASANELIKLAELDRKINGGERSQMTPKIATQLSAKLLPRAASAKSSGNWVQASEFAKKIVAVDPDNAQARSILAEANKWAEERYLQAYQMREMDPEGAIRMLKEVVNATSKDSEWNVKARQRLKQLGE